MLSYNNNMISLDKACMIGIKYYHQRQTDDAINLFRQIIDLDPVHPRALNALAVIDSEQGNHACAAAWLETLLTAHPDFAKGYNTRGMLLIRLDRIAEAEQDFLKAIDLNHNFAEAYGNLGDIHMLRREYYAAADCFHKVLSLGPGMPQAYSSLANALVMMDQFVEAEACLKRVFELAPEFPPALLAYGILQQMTGRFKEALAAFEKAVQYRPDDAVYHRRLGNACHNTGDLFRALECLLTAQRLNPYDPLIELDLGNLYWELNSFHKAEQAYRRGLQFAAFTDDIFHLRSGLGSALQSLGHPDKAIAEFRAALAIDPCNSLLHSNLLLAMYYPAEISLEEIFTESVLWGKNHVAAPIADRLQRATLPLKIGFISADFKEHSVSYFLEPLLAALDRKRFTVCCYSGVNKTDTVTERFKSLAVNWNNCSTIADEQLANMIVDDEIDVLVDLSGHTCGNRFDAMKHRPAPVQVTWLGFPGTTGLPAMDYRITDAVADPLGASDHMHTEKLIRLPGCFLCYLPPKDAPDVATQPLVKRGYVTFGSFNNLAKMTPQLLTVWGKVLAAVPDSRLLLKSRVFIDSDNRTHWQMILEELGIESERFSLEPFEKRKGDHFARYGEMDIALDTFPYNGTTTTCEALWMGVPVITLAGDRHASRVGASLLTSAGLEELIAKTIDEYISKAINLAGNVERLASYRHTMRDRLKYSPLCDATGFAARWEDAVIGMLPLSRVDDQI